MKNKLLRNFASGIGIRAFNIIATFVATPILLTYLGGAGYGFFVLLLGIIGFGGLLDLGLTQSLVRLLAGSKIETRQSICATAAWLYILLGTIGGLLIWIWRTPIVDYVVKMPQTYQWDMDVAMLFLAASIPLKLISTYISAILHAMEDIHEANIAQATGTLSRFIIASSLSAYNLPLEIVIASFPVSFIATLIIQLFYIKKYEWLEIYNIKSANTQHIKPLARNAYGIFIAQASGELALHADKFIISSVLGVSALAPYNIAYMLAARVSDIGSLLASVVFPRISSKINNNDSRSAWSIYRKGMQYTIALGALLIGSIVVFDEWFLTWWIGIEQTQKVLPLLIPFLIGTFIGLPSWLNGNMLIAFERSNHVAYSVLIGAAISIPLCFIATKNMGILGGAWAWAVGYIVIAVVQIILVRKLYNTHEKSNSFSK